MFRFFFVLFCVSLSVHHLFASLAFPINPEVENAMVSYIPEWKVEITKRYATGSPQEVLFLTPDHLWPMKQLSYFEDGSVAYEADLFPYNEKEEGKGSFHGVCRTFGEDGTLICFSTYEKGLKTSVEKIFDEEGFLCSETNYKSGRLDGKYSAYWPDGTLQLSGQLKDGLKEGAWISYADDGKKLSEECFRKGLLHGKRYQWGENGSVSETSYYRSGLLTDEGPGKPARTIFSPEGRCVEVDHCLYGSLHGENRTLFENGVLQKKVGYKLGKKEGIEEEYDPSGRVVAFCKYASGLPVERSWRLFENGQLSGCCTIQSPGRGFEEEFDQTGKKIKEYFVEGGGITW